jgi:hypothetical protein
LLLAICATFAPRSEAADRYVDADAAAGGNGTSWANAYTNLQSALTAAVSGDTIHVAQGTYKPTTGSDRYATFQLKNGVTLLGGYPIGGGTRDPATNETILSGDIGAAGSSGDNSYHVVSGTGTSSTAVLDGFIVSGGNANAGGDPDCYGGGMYNDGGSPSLANVTFSSNSGRWGGGMYDRNGSSPSLTNVTFSGNSTDDFGDGAGMYNDTSNPTLLNVSFTGNSAGASVGVGGGMYNFRSSPSLTNVTFSGNSADYGGGMRNHFDSDPSLTNVTFNGNRASSAGGGISNSYGSRPTVRNTIVWGDTPDEISNEGTASPTVSYCVVQGGYAGGSNIITADPKLGALGHYGGYTQTIPLLPGSPAMDAADAAYAPDTDQRGEPRPQGAGDDIGAYEALPSPEMDVQGNGISISDGDSTPSTSDHTNFGSAEIAGGTVDRTFTILNPGNAALNLSGAPAVVVGGTNAADFTVTVEPNSPVAARSSATFTVRFDPSEIGLRAATLSIANNDADENPYNFSIQGTAAFTDHGLYVDDTATGANNGSNWTDAFINLQSALALAASGDTIYVAQGTYKPTTGGSRTAAFRLETGVTLLGGYPNGGGTRDPVANVTTLSGDIGTEGSNGDNSYHVVIGSGTSSTAVLDGFTVSGGNANLSNTSNQQGGGIYNNYGAPTVTNVTFCSNSAYDGGGMYNYQSNPTVTDVTFTNNHAVYAGGGVFNMSSSPTLRNVTFSDNSAGDAGGGMRNYGRSNPNLTNVTFSGNSAHYGGGMHNQTGSSPTLRNATFSGNSAGWGGGIFNQQSDASVRNVIFWGNSGGQIRDSNSTSTVTDSVVQGGFAGGTNIITADPRLGTLGNYGGYTKTIPLRHGSSAIDTANPAYAPTTDQRGVARPVGAGYDIGAYEGELANEPPVAEAGPDQTVEQTAAAGTDVQLNGAGSTDPNGDALTCEWDVDGDGAYDDATGSTPTVALNLGEHAIGLKVTDPGGASDTDTVTITIVDTTDPELAVPADVTVEQASADGTPADLGQTTATDICDADVAITNDAPAVFPLGETIVTWTATDDSGNVTASTQKVTVTEKAADTTPPVLTVPADVTAEQTNRDGTAVGIGQATATDNVDADVTISNDAPAVFPLGETVVTWTATDDAGNVATTTQKVTVVDTTKPELTLPADVTAEQTNRDGTPADIGQATATDICDADVAITNDAPAVFPLGETVVTWTATDHSGNVVTAAQKVTVVDTTKPELTLPADATAEQTNRDGTPTDIGQATATDICDADVAITNDAPAVLPLGETVVTWTATDDAGNVATATQKVTVVDSAKPSLSVKVDAETVGDGDQASGEQSTAAGHLFAIEASASDVCDAEVALSVKIDDRQPQTPATWPMLVELQLGEHTLTVSATDDSGNVVTTTVTLKVTDTQSPTITAPGNITAEQTNRDGTPVNLGTPVVNDVCDVNPTITNDAPAVFPLGTTTVTWTAKDASGNVVTATQEVTIVDTTKPVLTVPAAVTAEQTSRNGTPANIGQATATDICDASPVITNNAPAVFPLGTTTVTWTAKDASGNVVTATQEVTIVDTTKPVLTAPAAAIAEQTSRNGTPANIGQANATDLCDASPVITNDAPAVFPLGTTTVTWTARDASGNVTTATQKVTIVDTTAPGVSSVTASPNQLWPPNHQMVDVTVTVGAADVCDAAPTAQIVSVTSNEPINGLGDGDTAPDWVITGNLTVKLRSERSGKGTGRVYTITVACTDASGNRSTRTVAVTVPKNQGGK